MRKLYEIKDDLANLIELDADRFVNGETGEIISKEAFNALNLEYEEKIEGVALGYKREDALVKAIDEEIKALKQRKEYHEKRRDGYKNFIAAEMAGKKMETAKVKISWRESDVVDVTCPVRNLPEVYLKYDEPKPDKVLMKKDMKNGVVIPGASLIKKQNVQIK